MSTWMFNALRAGRPDVNTAILRAYVIAVLRLPISPFLGEAFEVKIHPTDTQKGRGGNIFVSNKQNIAVITRRAIAPIIAKRGCIPNPPYARATYQIQTCSGASR